MEPIVLIGGGGHCISCIDVLEQSKQYEIIGIIDIPEKTGTSVLGYEIIGTDLDIPSIKERCSNFLITIGQIKSCATREKIFETIISLGGNLPTIISPIAYVSKHAKISKGTIIMHNVIVNANASIGKGCIINTKSLIEHEAVIGDFCHVSTNAMLNGQVQIGKGCFVGSGTVIANNISIADNVIIAAGSQVLKSIENTGTYIDTPLRKIR